MKKYKFYLTSDAHGRVMLWQHTPKYDGSYWTNEESPGVGIRWNFLRMLVSPGQCMELELKPNKLLFDYKKSPEYKLLSAIFNEK